MGGFCIFYTFRYPVVLLCHDTQADCPSFGATCDSNQAQWVRATYPKRAGDLGNAGIGRVGVEVFLVLGLMHAPGADHQHTLGAKVDGG